MCVCVWLSGQFDSGVEAILRQWRMCAGWVGGWVEVR